MGIFGTNSETGTSNPFKIIANIFISFIGAGVLGLPYAFKEAGILEGIFIMTLVGIISVKAMLLLVECKYRIIEIWETGDNSDGNGDGLYARVSSSPVERLDLLRNEELLVTNIKEPSRPLFTALAGNQDVSYGDVGYEALGSKGRLLVDFSIVLTQTGFCCAYLIFICKNLSDMAPTIEMGHWLLIILPLLSLLTLFRHLNSLALTSLLALCSCVLALSFVFWFDLKHFRSVRIHPKEITLENVPFFFVISVYCYEGAGLVLSLEGSMAKDIRHNFNRYLISTIVLVSILYISFGVCGYLSFGANTNQIITLNLSSAGQSFDISLVVKSLLCIALFFTYPVLMFPVMKLLEHYFIPDVGKSKWRGNIMRALVVLFTGVVVILIPHFADFMALVGACCCTLISFILPAIFHLYLLKGTGMSLKQLIIDWLLLAVGILGTIFGIWNAVVRLSSANETGKVVGETLAQQDTVMSTSMPTSLVTALQNITVNMLTTRPDTGSTVGLSSHGAVSSTSTTTGMVKIISTLVQQTLLGNHNHTAG